MTPTSRIVTKHVENAHAYVQRWFNIPERHRPTNIKAIDYNTVQYDYVEGEHPRNWYDVYLVAFTQLWGKYQTAYSGDRNIYLKYVKSLSPQPLGWVEDCILNAKLTHADFVHGDLTLANCILTPDHRIVFIDLGYHRGLPCREIDESKILQSLDGFDQVYRGWAPFDPDIERMHARPIHWALLATHYIRMLRHVSPIGVEFALKRIKEIVHNEDTYCRS